MTQTPAVFRHPGAMIDYTPSAAKTAGDVVVQGKLVGVCKSDIVANEKGALAVSGVFNMPKDASVISAAGTPLFWDEDGSPVGGTALSGAITTTATGNTFAGWALETAAADVGDVDVLLRSANDADTMSTDDLSDVGTVDHTAGDILIADGTKWECLPVSGDATLAANGAVTLNAAHQEQVVLIPVAALGAGADLSALTVFAHPRANTLVSIGYLSGGDGDFGTVSDASTSVFAVTDGAGNAIVTKTYNTATQPTANALNDLGALDGTHKVLTAAEIVKLAITNGATAKTPAGFLVIRTIPTNA
jgi:predicted RecA/RadA family phage recombinase